jgi:hypothetical protein
MYHPESDEICPHQGAWLNVYRNRGSKSTPLCLLQNCEHLSNKVKSTVSSSINSFLINDGKNTSARGLSLLINIQNTID